MTELCAQTGLRRNFKAEAKTYQQRTDTICQASRALRENEIHRTMAKIEAESDEFATAKEKAIENMPA